MAGFDMHVHSTASDGANDPASLVMMAKEQGLLGMALTDHDTVDGISEAAAKAKKIDFPLIAGIEFSSEQNERDVHILGYWFDPEKISANKQVKDMQDARYQRCYEIVARLGRLGFDLDADQIVASAGANGSLGRPHIAMAMVDAGYCSNIKEAFNKWLGRGMPGYVPRRKLDPFEAIEIILSADGIPVLAHPGITGMPDGFIPVLARAGLGGIEVYHPDHNFAAVRKYLQIAHRLRLPATGGSDFHIQGVRSLGCRITTVKQLSLLAQKREELLGKHVPDDNIPHGNI